MLLAPGCERLEGYLKLVPVLGGDALRFKLRGTVQLVVAECPARRWSHSRLV